LQLAERLELSQKRHDFYEKLPNVNGEENGNAGLEVAALQLDAVMELPQVNTRAGLYVFLNALVGHSAVSWLVANFPSLSRDL
jgi:mediator of RNA polymerase II transcription subunit 5